MLSKPNPSFSGLLPLVLLLVSGCGLANNRFTAEQVIERTFGPEAPKQVVVESFNGKIDVVTSDDGRVNARVTKRAGGSSQEAAEDDLENIDVAIVQEGNRIRVSARQTDAKPLSSRGAAVDLQVPAGTILELRTGNGKVSTTGLTGDVTAHSSNGAIQVKGSRGSLSLTTSNGKIMAEGGQGRLQLKTNNGSIDVKSGKSVVSAQSSNGSIHFTGPLAEGDHWFQTSNGKITLTLPADAEFHADAATSNGKIMNGFPVNATEAVSKMHHRDTVGVNPATSIKLHTSNGNIEIRDH